MSCGHVVTLMLRLTGQAINIREKVSILVVACICLCLNAKSTLTYERMIEIDSNIVILRPFYSSYSCFYYCRPFLIVNCYEERVADDISFCLKKVVLVNDLCVENAIILRVLNHWASIENVFHQMCMILWISCFVVSFILYELCIRLCLFTSFVVVWQYNGELYDFEKMYADTCSSFILI